MTFENLDMANDYANKRAAEISLVFDKTVYPMVFNVNLDEWAIGFLKEPSRPVKMEAIDRAISQGKTKAGEFLYNACLLKNESDPIFQSQDSKHDKIVMGAIICAEKVIEISLDLSKKNSSVGE